NTGRHRWVGGRRVHEDPPVVCRLRARRAGDAKLRDDNRECGTGAPHKVSSVKSDHHYELLVRYENCRWLAPAIRGSCCQCIQQYLVMVTSRRLRSLPFREMDLPFISASSAARSTKH